MVVIARLLVLLLAAIPLFQQASAQQNEDAALQQGVGASAYYAKDDFGGQQDTEIIYLPLNYDLDYGRWGFRALTSGLQVTGPGNVLVNVGGVTTAVAGNQITRESGVGDTLVSAIYRFDPIVVGNTTLPFVDLRLDAKLPTADERRGLGTGEWDYNVQLDLSQSLGSMALFASLGRTFRGDSPLYPGLEDSSYVQLGLARTLSQRWSTGLFYDHREQASLLATEIHELVPYLSVQVSPNWSLTGLLSFGFTEASASEAFLLQLGYRW